MHEDEGFDDTNPGGEEQTKPLKQPKAVKLQLFRSPSGSRVRLETKKFDSPSDKVPHSESKPEWSSETVVKVNEANKIVTVLWDGDKERVDELYTLATSSCSEGSAPDGIEVEVTRSNDV